MLVAHPDKLYFLGGQHERDRSRASCTTMPRTALSMKFPF